MGKQPAHSNEIVFHKTAGCNYLTLLTLSHGSIDLYIEGYKVAPVIVLQTIVGAPATLNLRALRHRKNVARWSAPMLACLPSASVRHFDNTGVSKCDITAARSKKRFLCTGWTASISGLLPEPKPTT